MNWSQLNIQKTYRPEQVELQDELRARGIDSELEYKVLRPELRCVNCQKARVQMQDHLQHHVEQLYYQFDLHLLNGLNKYLVELDGSIHKRKGVKRHDEQKEAFAESRGYVVLRYSSKKRPYRIAEDIVSSIGVKR